MLTALTAGWAVLYADRTSMYPLLSVIAESLALTSTQAGAITSAYFLLYVAMQVPAGILGDRFGLKRVLAIMYAVSAIGILGLGLNGGSYGLLLVFAALHGLGAGAYYPTAYGTILQIFPPERRGFSSAVLGIGMAVGLLAGMAMSGPIYQYLGSCYAPFVLLSIPTFLMVFFFNRFVPNVKGTRSPSWDDYRAVLGDRELCLINGLTFLALYGFWVAITWGPTFLHLERGFSLGQAGLYTGLMALTAVPAALIWGRLSDRFGRKPIAMFILPAAAATLYFLSQAQSHAAITLILLIFGAFTNSAFTPIMAAWTGDIVSQRYPGLMGAAVGIFNGLIMTAAIVAPLISGYIRDMTGSLSMALMVGSVAMLAAAGLLFLLPAKATSGRTQPQS